MRKILIPTLLSLLFTVSTFAQGVQQLIPEGQCHYYGGSDRAKIYTFSSDEEAVDVVRQIMDHTGLSPNFIVKAADVSNAAAVNLGKQRYILYNREFMRKVKEAAKIDWAGISIMAHEIGHHLQGHTLTGGGSRPPTELEADSFSGAVLFKMGASLADAQLAMKLLAGDEESDTHPARHSRLAAIEDGWTKARNLQKGKTKAAEPRESDSPNQTSTRSSAPDAQYAFKCIFYNDPQSYYITNSNTIVAVTTSGQVMEIGKRLPPISPVFIWMYSLQHLSYGVDSSGKIWNRTPYGQMVQVGYVVRQ